MSVTVDEAQLARPAAPPHAPAAGSGRGTLAVVRRGLRDRRMTTVWWGGSLAAWGVLMVCIYPSIRRSMDQLIRNYPAGLKEAFGVTDMNTIQGYLHAELFSLIIPLAIGYFAIHAVAEAIAGAEEHGRLDTILTLPLRRRALIAGSYVVAIAVSLAILLLFSLITYLAAQIAGTDLDAGHALAGALGTWPLAVFSGGVAALACGGLHNARAVTGVSLGVLVGMYAIDLAGRLAHGVEGIRWASAFRYYGAPIRDGLDPLNLLVLIGAGLALAAAGAVLFERRDVLH